MPENDIPFGFCACGCGEKTKIATRTRKEAGWVKGQPLLYLLHHYGLETVPKEAPNPTGICACGCGELAPIAKRNNANLGHIRGQPVRFIVGHHVRLKPMRAVDERFWEKVDKRGPNECWLWIASCDSHGYGQFNYEGECWAASRFAYFLTQGPIAVGISVCHNCPGGDQPACCNPAHLWEGTQADNSLDMWAKGRGNNPPRTDHGGENGPRALFTNAQVRELRRQHAETGINAATLARMHKVCEETMRQILRRITYQDA